MATAKLLHSKEPSLAEAILAASVAKKGEN